MKLSLRVIWAELTFKALKAAMMLEDDYSKEDVIKELLEIVHTLENSKPY